KHQDFHRKGHKDEQEREQLQAHRHPDERNLYIASCEVHREVLHTSGRASSIEIEEQDTDQHEHAAEERVQQELPRRVDTARHPMLDHVCSPDANQQEHRGQFDFPEEEEEQQVQSQKDAHHARLKQQEQGQIFFDALFL